MFDTTAFLFGAGHFLIAFAIACLFLAVFKWLYQVSTPYDERRLVAEGNMAAAITFGGAIVGFALPLASALEVTANPLEFVAWGVLAGAIQVVASLVVRRIVIRDLVAKIETGNVASAVYMAATSIAVGLLNAACMSY
ncbi:DUF350 domain-containing protein [uncultured Sphingomonas sp.]|uniref:DUF350 domain-containing protein n=1 Tax=uncultured Sphingomonas sp. TaxID=158754 RepID=UPI0030F54EEC